MTHLGRISSALLAAAFLTSQLLAQSGAGAVKGTLTDESGAVIPAATITLNGSNGAKTVQSQADGTYSFPGLAPGQYTVSLSYPGFAPFSHPVTVTPGSTIQVPIQLQVSTENQKVTVNADSGPTVTVEPENNATALVIKGEDLQALPDDPDDLASAPAGAGGSGRRTQRRADIYRRLLGRATAAEGIYPRGSHQPKSIFSRIRPAGLRAHRNLHQAGNRQVPRHAISQR